MLFKRSASGMLTCIFYLLTLEACTEAAILGPRQESEHSVSPSKMYED